MVVWTHTTKTFRCSVRKSDLLTIHGNVRGRERPNLIWIEIIKKDITICNLSINLVLNIAECKKKIHVADLM